MSAIPIRLFVFVQDLLVVKPARPANLDTWAVTVIEKTTIKRIKNGVAFIFHPLTQDKQAGYIIFEQL